MEHALLVFKFYKDILQKTPFLSVFTVFLGFIGRALSVLSFVLAIKVFLVIINAKILMVIEPLNTLLQSYTDFKLTESTYILFIISIYGLVLLSQFVVSKVYFKMFCNLRYKSISLMIHKPLNEHQSTNIRLCLRLLPSGLEGMVKSLEIIMFYIVLFSVIFVISPLLCFALISSIPLLLVVVVFIGREEVFVKKELKSLKKEFFNDIRLFEPYTVLTDKHYKIINGRIENAKLFGGLLIIIMMIVFLFNYQDDQFETNIALILVFSIRFIVLYAGELSRLVGRLLEQRVEINSFHHLKID